MEEPSEWACRSGGATCEEGGGGAGEAAGGNGEFKEADGTGMGDGQGARDVSDQIEEQDQLAGALQGDAPPPPPQEAPQVPPSPPSRP